MTAAVPTSGQLSSEQSTEAKLVEMCENTEHVQLSCIVAVMESSNKTDKAGSTQTNTKSCMLQVPESDAVTCCADHTLSSQCHLRVMLLGK